MTTLPRLESLAAWDERLRLVARDPAAVERARAAARALLAETQDERKRCRLHGYLGNAALLVGEHDEAAVAHERSREIARRLGDSRALAAATIRLAEAHRCADRLDEAEALLRAVLDGGELRDFALQHLGKTLVDAGRADEAVPTLEAALELRLAGGDAELVASTEQALALARSRTR